MRMRIAIGALIVLAAIGAAFAWAIWASEGQPSLAELTGDAPRQAASLPPLPQVGLPGAVPDEDVLLDVTAETAQEMNAERAFSSDPIIAAKPYFARLEGIERERALHCLAIAGIFEAGGDLSDQEPVMQVVINRARHPAFPNSICAVVFQGAERRTGCQFSFTCDGSMLRRRPSAASLNRSMGLARRMLNGKVDGRVGLATHFHTDWVLPYWSSSLDKVAAVKTHIFFRWRGFWGTPRAFKNLTAGSEPRIAQLASYTPAHSASDVGELPLDEAFLEDMATGSDRDTSDMPPAAPVTAVPKLAGAQVMTLPAGSLPGQWALTALERCDAKTQCRIAGWAGRPAPVRLDRAALTANPPDFVFVQDLPNRTQQPYWNCAKWPRVSTSRCIGNATQAAALLFDG